MIHLAIIEDNAIYLDALETYIANVPGIQVVHTASNLQQMAQLLILKPHVVIMDIDLGKDSGIRGIKMIKDALPHTGILMLTVFDDEEKIIQCIQAGASGYLLKKDSPKVIMEAVRSLYNGEGAINGQVAKKIFEAFPKPAPGMLKLEDYRLTKREIQIVQLLINGLSYKEIATRCFISMATLNSHISNIYIKLNVHSRSEIAARFRL